jgi:hypothetical protein
MAITTDSTDITVTMDTMCSADTVTYSVDMATDTDMDMDMDTTTND